MYPTLIVSLILLILSACSAVTHDEQPSESAKANINHSIPSSQKPTQPPETAKPEMDASIRDQIKREADDYLRSINFNGAVLIAKDNTLIMEEGFGLADQKLQKANEPATLFRIASLTKQFTAAGILQLEEKGLLSTEDTLEKYFPEWDNWGNITIHRLLSQTSGIKRETQSFVNTPVEEILKANAKLPLASSNTFQYSNLNYVLLGRIIEQLSKLSYEEYIKQFILEPTFMIDSGITFDKDANVEDFALGEGSSMNDFATAVNYEGAGSLYTTVMDLYLWNEALSNELVISKPSRERMFTSYSNREYGYGWFLDGNAAYHLGNINGFGAIITRSLSDNSVIIVLSNQELRRAQTVPISNKLAKLMGKLDMVITQ